ncbi:MAG: hypothetical protein H7320_04150 [Ferruginibacter sp.]|nr:hypothetical protein [Ferruginibacter sp.]
MERVETLLQKLQQQFNEKLPIDKLLLTVQMLHYELAHLKGHQPKETNESVAISMPLQIMENLPAEQIFKTLFAEEEKTVEILQVDEAAVEAELEEIKRNATVRQNIGAHSKPQLLFQPSDDEIPTLIHQQPVTTKKEVNDWVSKDHKSVNDTLKEITTELSARLSEGPVKDLKKAIGVNDRFLFINELFRGDEAMYERSIKTINSFTIWPEAEYWIRRELKTKLGWTDSNETVQQFDQLIRRRFS